MLVEMKPETVVRTGTVDNGKVSWKHFYDTDWYIFFCNLLY